MAEDESLQRRVAIKVPKVSDPKQASSYLNEARKAAAIECEGIVPIYHVAVQANGVPFVVQKLIDGPSMRDLLRQHGALPPAHAVTLMRDVAKALAAAHQRGIYHRDLKPDNVLVDSRGVPWIADFGLAISENEQASQPGQIAGTLAYMSPEQIEGHVDWLDGRTDIWALGIMLYELLSGRPPFEGRTRQSLMQQICHRDPRPLQQRSQNLPPELDEVFLACCAKRPSDRFASADVLAAALTRLIDRGLSVDPIDGSEFKSKQAISQYSSLQRSGNLSIGADAASTRHSVGRTAVESEWGSRQSGVEAFPAAAASASQSGIGGTAAAAPVASPAGSWSRTLVATAFGLLIVGAAIGGAVLSRWPDGQTNLASDKGFAESGHKQADAAIGLNGSDALRSAEQALSATVSGIVAGAADRDALSQSSVDTADPSTAASQMSQQVPTIVPEFMADGSADLPWVVASDGTGSHRSIADAVAVASNGHTIHIRPGTYNEAVKIALPLTLVGLGDRGHAEIVSTKESPVEITCPIGTVQLKGLSIRGDGRRHGTEFNAINLVTGKLSIKDCDIRSHTFNTIKMSPGTTLAAQGCHFLDSDQFAIVAKGHAAMIISQCEFFNSGLQLVDGAARVSECNFYGREGIYVQRSVDVKTVIEGCSFNKCSKYAILATDSGLVDIEQCSFVDCLVGVQAFRSSEAVVRGGSIQDCAQAINVNDADLSADGVVISGGELGATMKGGRLRLVNVQITDVARHGVTVEQDGRLEIRDSAIASCDQAGVSMTGGSFTLERSSIEKSYFGVYVSDAFREGEMRAVEFRNNRKVDLVMEAGSMVCEQVQFVGGKSDALTVLAAESEPVEISLREVTFRDKNYPVGTGSYTKLNLEKIEPADVPILKLFHFDVNSKIYTDRE
jgi:eukaryotic-like serine/threonine-protein kinase